jgi:hypothetical protein
VGAPPRAVVWGVGGRWWLRRAGPGDARRLLIELPGGNRILVESPVQFQMAVEWWPLGLPLRRRRSDAPGVLTAPPRAARLPDQLRKPNQAGSNGIKVSEKVKVNVNCGGRAAGDAVGVVGARGVCGGGGTQAEGPAAPLNDWTVARSNSPPADGLCSHRFSEVRLPGDDPHSNEKP